MFIKRDLRKLIEILDESNESHADVLNLSRRQSEFVGSTKTLFNESRVKALRTAKILNLYDNALTSLQGLEVLCKLSHG